ncbi:MAG: MgtC/SapB family protein [Candidatus Paceibacterota bacterium]|jgi:putative Mg2+ transporter-C (MgtC) family protein
MLTLEQMIIRLVVAVVLGAIVGFEREWIGKEAGIRTNIMVAAGSAIFAIISISLPYLITTSPENLSEVIARNSGFLSVIANVVVGVGFLGAGIIVKHGMHVRGLTTAATVWFASAIGVLAGIGLTSFAAVATLSMVFLLVVLRKLSLLPRTSTERGESVDD